MKTRVFWSAAATAAVATPALIVTCTGPTAAATVPEAEPTAKHCSTRMLTEAELNAGARSVIVCSTTFEGALRAQGLTVAPGASPQSMRPGMVRPAFDGSGLVAIHYDGGGAIGASLSVAGTVCNGGGIWIDPSDWWNDRISSTRHQACSTIKHWEHPSFSGVSEITQQPSGYYWTLNATNNIVSAIRYYGPNN